MVDRKKMKAWMRGEQQHDLGSAVVAGRALGQDGHVAGQSRESWVLRKEGETHVRSRIRNLVAVGPML